MKKTIPRDIKSNCSKQVTKKILKVSREKRIRDIQRNRGKNDVKFLMGNNAREKTVTTASLKY